LQITLFSKDKTLSSCTVL